MNNQPAIILRDGVQTRDWNNFKNITFTLLKASDNPDVIGNIFNVSYGKRIIINEIIKILEEKIGKKLKFYIQKEI